MVGIFHGYVGHNHMVYSVADGSYLLGITPGLPSQGENPAVIQSRNSRSPVTR